MITLQASENKIFASYINNNFASGEKVYLPDSADTSQWKEFDNEDEAREYFGVIDYENMTNAEMLLALGVQPNQNEVI